MNDEHKGISRSVALGWCFLLTEVPKAKRAIYLGYVPPSFSLFTKDFVTLTKKLTHLRQSECHYQLTIAAMRLVAYACYA